MNLLKSQSIGYSLFSSSSELKTRNEAQRCIYATWPSTDMTFANPTELFQLLSIRLDWTKPQQQRELLLLGLRIVEPLFSKCRIFSRWIPPWCLVEHVPRRSSKYSKSNLGVLWGPAVFWQFLAFYYLYCFANTLQRLLMHFSYHTRTKKRRMSWCSIFAKKKCVLAFLTAMSLLMLKMMDF